MSLKPENKFNILCVGPMWRGSNANGLFYALGRKGHAVKIIDDRYYFNFQSKSKVSKLINRASRLINITEYNEAILRQVKQVKPDILLVFKGGFVLQQTVKELKTLGVFTTNFYPDVSFTTHTPHLPKTLKEYDLIFTTKTFGVTDMKQKLGVNNVIFMPHGFDPNVHRKLEIDKFSSNPFLCDISFIGGHSKKKEKTLESLKKCLPKINLKIYGEKWGNSKTLILKSSIAGFGVTNDLYPLCIGSSKINLGLLHEKVSGASSGDKITSRTFHIPASGGFLMHERTDEVLKYFKEDNEIVCFENAEELASKVEYYLANEEKRITIKDRGYRRVIRDHSLDVRAQGIIELITERFN